MKKHTVRYILESLIYPLIVGIFNLFFPDMPGFAQYFFIPYLFISLITSSLYGNLYGFLTLGFAMIVSGFIVPVSICLLYGVPYTFGNTLELLNRSVVPVILTMIIVYINGAMRYSNQAVLKKYKDRIEALTKDHWNLKEKSQGLLLVNQELEERVSGQEESITSLYSQIQKLNTLDVDKALDALLETVAIFTHANKISIWEYLPRENSLGVRRTFGWEEGDARERILPIENTIEGWVYRNNTGFSVKDVLKYDTLRQMDTGGNIITIPINLNNRVWGIVNISEMPFYKYNQHSERLLSIIINLTESALWKAVEHENLIKKDEVDRDSGLPLYSQFIKRLADAREMAENDNGTLSVILFEITNYELLVQEFGVIPIMNMVPLIILKIEESLDTQIHSFKYREENQIALIVPHLDFDGASLFCFEALGVINEIDWELDKKSVMLEIIVGYASFSGTETEPELLKKAEYLLEMQKL